MSPSTLSRSSSSTITDKNTLSPQTTASRCYKMNVATPITPSSSPSIRTPRSSPPSSKAKSKSMLVATRSLAIIGPSRTQVTFATTIPGKLVITPPIASRPAPPPPTTPTTIRKPSSASSSSQTTNAAFSGSVSKPTLPRSPSLAPTELCTDEELSQEEITKSLSSLGIKVRDYAYVKPSPSPSSTLTSATPPPPVVIISNPFITSPIPELWYPNAALAEYDYRTSCPKRTYPITGKNLSRLLAIGWLTPFHLQRCHPMDIAELDRYRNVCLKRSGTGRWEDGEYPYKPMWTKTAMDGRHRKEKEMPSMLERSINMGTERVFRNVVDEAWRKEEEKQRHEERKRKEMEEEREIIRRMEVEAADRAGQRSMATTHPFATHDQEDSSVNDVDMTAPITPTSQSRSKKRAMTEDEDQVNPSPFPLPLSPSESTDSRSPPSKRRRTTPSPSPVPFEPKQYPAPLHSYDPELHHHVQAAKDLYSRSQEQSYSLSQPHYPSQTYSRTSPTSHPMSMSQPKPSTSPSFQGRHHTRDIQRADTPSADSDTGAGSSSYPHCFDTPRDDDGLCRSDTPPLDDPEDGESARPRTLGRRLSRTITYNQIL